MMIVGDLFLAHCETYTNMDNFPNSWILRHVQLVGIVYKFGEYNSFSVQQRVIPVLRDAVIHICVSGCLCDTNGEYIVLVISVWHIRVQDFKIQTTRKDNIRLNIVQNISPRMLKSDVWSWKRGESQIHMDTYEPFSVWYFNLLGVKHWGHIIPMAIQFGRNWTGIEPDTHVRKLY